MGAAVLALCRHLWCPGCAQFGQGPGSRLLPPSLSGPHLLSPAAVGLPQSNEHFQAAQQRQLSSGEGGKPVAMWAFQKLQLMMPFFLHFKEVFFPLPFPSLVASSAGSSASGKFPVWGWLWSPVLPSQREPPSLCLAHLSGHSCPDPGGP